MNWMFLPLKRYADFDGRSRRMEYWMFALFQGLVYLILLVPMFIGGMNPENFAAAVNGSAESSFSASFFLGMGLLVVFVLAMLIPNIAVTVRRLHDRDMSGWWYLGFIVIGMIPLIGWIGSIAFLVLMFLPGTAGPNQFGDDPKDPNSASVFE